MPGSERGNRSAADGGSLKNTSSCCDGTIATGDEIAHRLYRYFEAGDIDALLELLDPEVEWELVGPQEIPYFGKYKGLDEVRRFFERLGSSLEVERFDVDTITVTASGAVAEGSEQASFKANGVRYEMRWCHVIEVEHERIVRFTDYLDTAPMLAAWVR